MFIVNTNTKCQVFIFNQQNYFHGFSIFLQNLTVFNMWQLCFKSLVKSKFHRKTINAPKYNWKQNPKASRFRLESGTMYRNITTHKDVLKIISSSTCLSEVVMCLHISHLKKAISWSAIIAAIFDSRLLRQIVCVFNRWRHSCYSEEGRQVGRIWGY